MCLLLKKKCLQHEKDLPQDRMKFGELNIM